MKIKRGAYTTITAEDGYFLTNHNGVYGFEIVLGNIDNPDNYSELPISEWPEIATGSDYDVIDTDIDFDTTGTDFDTTGTDSTNDNVFHYTVNNSIAYAKNSKIHEIEEYDKSDNVNSFYYDGHKMWLDRETRASLKNTIESFTLVGREYLNIWYETTQITLDLQSARMLLAALEVYATDCYNTTAQHKVNIYNLTDIDEVNAYDITVGYPAKLEL